MTKRRLACFAFAAPGSDGPAECARPRRRAASTRNILLGGAARRC